MNIALTRTARSGRLALRHENRTSVSFFSVSFSLGRFQNGFFYWARKNLRPQIHHGLILAKDAARDTVKGLRTVTHHEITDAKALLNWLARNRRDDVMAFLTEWARRNHRDCKDTDGLRVWTEKEAF